jgi:AraC family transcriptional regulator
VACLSPFHFHRVFRGMLGEPLAAHVRRIRLERAATRLRLTRRSVIDIAFEAGYDSHEAFTRAFRAGFGLSPTEYRRRGGPPVASLTSRVRSGVHYADGQAGPRDFRSANNALQNMDVIIEQLPPARVAYIRHIGPYHSCGATWDRLCAWMGKEGYLGPGCRFIGISYDDPDGTPADKIRYDACVTVDQSFRPVDDIGVQTLAGGEYARVTHHGAYDDLKKVYAALLGQWLPRSGRTMRDLPCFEVYLNDPFSTEPEDLLTDIHLPLAPR